MLLGKRFDEQGSGGITTAGASMMMSSMGFHSSLSGRGAAAGSAAAGSSSGARLGLFGLGNRAARVLTRVSLEESVILPHVSVKSEVKVRSQIRYNDER